MFHDIYNQMYQKINNFSLLINSLLPLKVSLHGTSSTWPNLLSPVDINCRVCSSRTAQCCEAIIMLQYGHVKGGKNTQEKYLFDFTTKINLCALFSNHV